MHVALPQTLRDLLFALDVHGERIPLGLLAEHLERTALCFDEVRAFAAELVG